MSINRIVKLFEDDFETEHSFFSAFSLPLVVIFIFSQWLTKMRERCKIENVVLTTKLILWHWKKKRERRRERKEKLNRLLMIGNAVSEKRKKRGNMFLMMFNDKCVRICCFNWLKLFYDVFECSFFGHLNNVQGTSKWNIMCHCVIVYVLSGVMTHGLDSVVTWWLVKKRKP